MEMLANHNKILKIDLERTLDSHQSLSLAKKKKTLTEKDIEGEKTSLLVPSRFV